MDSLVAEALQDQEQEAQEVSYDEAKADHSEQPTPEPKEEDVVDILVPKSEPKTWVIGKGDYQRSYVQRELSFIGKMQWFSLVGEVLDKALSGQNAMSLNSLFSAPGRPGELSMNDFRDADTFVQAIGKLLVYAPDFLVKSYCIWLGVPDYEKELAAEIMKQSPEEGGLTDSQGIEIIEVFIDQNYEALTRFFREEMGRVQKRLQAQADRARTSRQSKP